eukprot:UN10164
MNNNIYSRLTCSSLEEPIPLTKKYNYIIAVDTLFIAEDPEEGVLMYPIKFDISDFVT